MGLTGLVPGNGSIFSNSTIHCPSSGNPGVCLSQPSYPAAIIAAANNSDPFPGRYNGRSFRPVCRLLPLVTQQFFGDSFDSNSIAFSGFPNLTAVIAIMAKSHHHRVGYFQHSSTNCNVLSITVLSIRSLSIRPKAPSIEG